VHLIASLEKWKGQCEKNRVVFFLYIFFGVFNFLCLEIKLLDWEWCLLHDIMRFLISKKASFPLSTRLAKGV
jgi:hypothetical protein